MSKESFKISGYNADVDSAANEVIKSSGGTFTKMSAAGTLTIVSDSADDDGVASGTLTLSSAVANAFATATVTCASVQAGDTVTVNALVYTAVSGSKADNTEFSIDTSDDAAATDLADSISNDTRTGTVGGLSATSSTDTVTITTTVEGTAGDAVTLVSSEGTRLAVSGATFSGGVDADVATVNGLTYTAVAGTKADNTEFSIDTSDTAAAADLADSIANDTRTGVTEPTLDVTATSALGIVTIHCTTGGGVGEGIDISGTANITASDTNLVGSGTGAQTIFIDGVDAAGYRQQKAYSLNGTTSFVTNESWLGVNSVVVSSVGTGATNAGNISITATSGGSVQSYIVAGVGKSEQAVFIVPKFLRSEIRSITVNASIVGSASLVQLFIIGVDGNGVKKRLCSPITIDSSTESHAKVTFNETLKVTQEGYWWVEASTTVNNTIIAIEVDHEIAYQVP